MDKKSSIAIKNWFQILVQPVKVLSSISFNAPNLWRWNWALIILIAIEVFSQIIIFNQAPILDQAKTQYIEDSKERMKADKKLPHEIAGAVEIMEKNVGSIFFIGLNSGRAVIETIARMAMITAGFWILLRAIFDKFPSLSPCMETVGLCSAPLALGILVKLVMVVVMGDMTVSPSLAMFISVNDPLELSNVALTLINPFYIWSCLLLAISAIHVWQTPKRKTFVWVYLGWIMIWFGFAFLQRSISLRGG